MAQLMLHDIGNGAMNAPQHWQLSDDFRLYTRFSYPFGVMNFIAKLVIRVLIANSCTRWRGIFKWPSQSQDRGRADFSRKILGSLFNKYLTNEPNFGRIHLARQYL